MEGPECPAAPQLPSVPLPGESAADAIHESPSKRLKLDHGDSSNAEPSPRLKGVAPIKPEYLVSQSGSRRAVASSQVDDDAAEGANDRLSQGAQGTQGKKDKKNKKQKGQNTGRDFGFSRDALQLCASRALQPEFSPLECKFGDSCKFEHDLRKYLSQGKREDLTTFKGVCPVWNARGICPVGWKCRFVGSHSEERLVDGRNELVLIEDPVRRSEAERKGTIDGEVGVVNVVTAEQKANLSRRRMGTPKSDVYLEWESKYYKDTQAASKEHGTNMEQHDNTEGEKRPQAQQEPANTVEAGEKEICEANTAREDNRAQYRESPMLPSEKRRLYYGPETPVLAPLTTQGNLPFRRLCVELGAQVTWSEMALGLPLIQGHKPEWALMKAHESEITPPRVQGKGEIVNGYDNSKDLKFGAQIASNKPWLAVKTAEILTTLCPRLRAIDLNCGCPIELVYRQGAGSALLDAPGKLEKILRGMNVVSGEVPITVKIRMGTRDNQPTAEKLIKRLILGGQEAPSPSGVAAITLHGRSRQQRYTRDADWEYISNCAALIQRLKQSENEAMDTALEPDARYKPNNGKVYFVGNGDCYSHADYYSHIQEAKVDTVMVARGALIKPWIFEEIEKGQYLDKSASERLEYIERFVKFGLEAWGSDEMGVGTTRRFLLEWLSFSCRYVPIGLLEYLPPRIQDRPPAYKGRNELETLLSSDNYKDWIKISEMFLGPAHPNFRFEPKHKSNSYEVEAEG